MAQWMTPACLEYGNGPAGLRAHASKARVLPTQIAQRIHIRKRTCKDKYQKDGRKFFCEELCRFLLTFWTSFFSCLFWWGPQHGRSLCPLRTPLFKEILIKIGRPVGFSLICQNKLNLYVSWMPFNHTPWICKSANLWFCLLDLQSLWTYWVCQPTLSASVPVSCLLWLLAI